MTATPMRSQQQQKPPLLARVGAGAARRFRAVLVLAALVCGAALALSAGVNDQLAGGGYTPSDSESAVAQRTLSERFQGGTPNLVLVAEPAAALDAPETVDAARRLQQAVRDSGKADWVHSFWETGDPALVAPDGRAAMFAVRLSGEEDHAQRASRDLVPELQRDFPGLRLSATGEAQVNAEVNEQSQVDLVWAELLGAPLVGLLLLLVFRTPLAALLPLAIGAVSVTLTLAVLTLLTKVTDVSMFAMNITTALGFGLAVDYSLFIVTRYREELAAGRTMDEAIATSTAKAGRTVLFSAVTVAVSLAALLVFPLYFLRSLAYAALPVVLIAGIASIVVLPALLRLTGRHLARWDVLSRFIGPPRTEGPMWHRIATSVMRRPLLTSLPVIALLLVFAIPFADVRFGLTDERVLPPDAGSHRAATIVDERFPQAKQTTVEVLLTGAGSQETERYAQELSQREGVTGVQAPGAVYVEGAPVAPGQPARTSDETAWITMAVDHEPYDTAAEDLVRSVRAAPAPGELAVAGDTAVLVDTKASLLERLPAALALLGLSTLVLLFLFTGSVLIPFKAILMNLLSLTASFGAAVYVFQYGNLRWLVGDFTVTGHIEVTIPVLMFCIAFGLSMDYEVFLLSRIREQYLIGGHNEEAVAIGLERTGRLVTAAAGIVAAVLLVLATSQLSILKLLGVGLTLAVVVDAALVRAVIVPAFMRLMGRANWWAPPLLRRVHRRIGISESGD
ncbi:RND superfamily putative drug exporter [Saccharopolyspora erythraea NRRL 2338]|uniref:Transporter n=1 Tax=Saccharopolyspora erythraea TaxID=1836 RepID=Q5VKQ9_SACER|nr:MMPL family transporter [Saccharopolyspora erythraea]AAQ94253.1 transporter [Saccharopolyspora erythraea]PFG97103.1 RND superfamily putative drug exporter [Saccharopolyspora erythraea NRRL 2338]